MSHDKPHDDGPGPAAERLSESLRQLTDMQRQSVAAASGLFDQLIDEVQQRETPRLEVNELLSPLAADGDGSAPLAQIRTSVTRAIDLYSELLNEAFGVYADAVEQVLRRGDGTRPASASGAGSPVTLSARPGGEATANVWLHNLTSTPMTGARLWMTSLTAHNGSTLGEIACGFTPAALDVEPGSSASAALSLTVPSQAAAGGYHGLVLASGAPAASVPLLLTVH